MTSGGEQKNTQGGKGKKKFARLQRVLAALPVEKLASCMDYCIES